MESKSFYIQLDKKETSNSSIYATIDKDKTVMLVLTNGYEECTNWLGKAELVLLIERLDHLAKELV